MEWERGYLKSTVLWLIVLATSIALLYFDKSIWAVILWLANISYQLIVLSVLLVVRSEKN
jgi:hypothetical protein